MREEGVNAGVLTAPKVLTPPKALSVVVTGGAPVVAAGTTASVLIGLDAPLPEPGGEAVRQFTLVARYGARTAEAGGTFRQRTSPPPLNAIKLRVEPPIVRVRDSDRGRTWVVADNRLGTRPARIWLAGRDHEGTAAITLSAPYLDVYPGQQASAEVAIRSRRPPSGTNRRTRHWRCHDHRWLRECLRRRSTG
jgi:hypothetical protein